LIRNRVLVVEDHDDSRNLLARLLGQHYEVLTATNFESALAVAAELPPSTVITDIALGPGGDGLALMREIRKTHQICGIAVSGYPPKNPELLIDAGLIKWIIKPIQFSELLEAVAEACAAAGNGDCSGMPPISDPSQPDFRGK
jgi:DNA-binding response OmpR family regulator